MLHNLRIGEIGRSDANGNELGFNDNGGQGTAALLGLTLESGQTVSVKVGGKPGGGSGNYELLVTSDRIADGDDYADTLRLALKEQSSLLSLADGSSECSNANSLKSAPFSASSFSFKAILKTEIVSA